MNSHDLIQFACQLALRTSLLVDAPTPFARSSIEQYWAASKCRLDRWGRVLKNAAPWKPGYLLDASDERFRDHVVEILTSEILTRVWTAISVAHDRRHGVSEAEPIARSVLIAHLDVRRRVLGLLARRAGLIDPAAGYLNDLRRQCERTTDLLIACSGSKSGVLSGAFDEVRTGQLVEKLGTAAAAGSHNRWRVLTASVPWSFDTDLLAAGPNADLNGAITSALLSCFAADAFDGSGLTLPADSLCASVKPTVRPWYTVHPAAESPRTPATHGAVSQGQARFSR